MTWAQLLADQLDFYLQQHLLPRLVGLTDEEYRWSPTDAPTLEWRLCHIAVDNLGTRVSAFFPDADTAVPPGTPMFDPRHRPATPGSASEAVGLLERVAERWLDAISSLDDAALLAPLGPVGEYFAADPMAALVLHVSRETMHHGGEICLLRDLYAAR